MFPVLSIIIMADFLTGILSTTARSGWIRLRTLIMLRWLAIAGQIIAVAVAEFLLSIDLPLELCAATIGASIAFNVIGTTIFEHNHRLSERDAALTLIFDLCQLSLLLYLVGGLSNPFSVLILVPVTIAAASLTLRSTIAIGFIAVMLISTLLCVNLPLKMNDGTLIERPDLLRYGFWTALVVTIVFMSFYTRRVTQDSFSMSQALSATHLALVREQRFSALCGVVAAAAHELGTPLATIKLVAAELSDELADNPELREDAELIASQADRCRDIMRDMGDAGKDDMHLRHAPVSAIIEEAAEPHQHRGKNIHIRVGGVSLDENPPDQIEIPRHPEIVHGLRNLIQNAVDFSKSNVWVDIDWTRKDLRIHIGDDGPGYPPDLIGKIGDPFVRKRGIDSDVASSSDRVRPGYDGMGLGLFIAKTLLERTGARLTFANGSGLKRNSATANLDAPELANATGAIVELVWKRSDIEADRAETRGPLGENQLFSG